jgi:hypothetical protein
LEAESRGHKHLVLGGLNIRIGRIGRMSSDVPCMAVPPALQGPTTSPDLHHHAQAVQRRASVDSVVTCRRKADAVRGGGLLHVDMFAHNKSGIAYQDGNRRSKTVVNHKREPHQQLRLLPSYTK